MENQKKHKKQRIQTGDYGTSDIAAMCRVTAPTVAKWIDEGKMASYLTAGGHRRVSESDLVSFMQSLNIPLPAELRSSAPLHILIVDDDPEDREHIAFVLRKNVPDAILHQAQNGFDMGHKVATFQPALVLLDLMMPGISGFDVCELIRKDTKLRSTKILAISGLDDAATHSEVLARGADAFFSKNSDDDDFVQKVKQLLTVRRETIHAAT